MLSIRYHGPKDLRIDEMSKPEIGADELLIKTEAAAICGSDVRMWQSNLIQSNVSLPLVLGHEFAGTIVATGRNVDYYQEGMRVAIAPNYGCGVCDQCVSGNTHLCSNYQAFGINFDGAFAEFVRVPAIPIRSGNLVVLPDSVSAEEAALNEPLSCVYNGFTKCRPQAGEIAMVVGAGPVGLLHAQLLSMAGLTVIMNDLSESRLNLSRNVLPSIITYQGSDGLADYIESVTLGRGLDVVIVACPVPSVQASVLSLMNYGGRINFFGGIPKSAQPVAIDTNIIHYKELYLTGSTRASVSQYRKTLDFILSGRISLKSIITNRVPLSNGLEAFQYAEKGIGLKNIIVFSQAPVPVNVTNESLSCSVKSDVTK